MPHYAWVKASLECPYCGGEVTDAAAFQWGFCPERFLDPEYAYRVGDAIRWRPCADGSILSWTYFEDSPIKETANPGDPHYLNVIVKDSMQFDWITPEQ